MSINVVVLVGNAGRDPELRFFESGSCVCEFTLAINRPPRDGQEQNPLWVNCKAWVKTAQVAGDYVRKGSKVAVVGRLEIEQWTDRTSGEVRSKTLVVIDRLELCGSRGGGDGLSTPAPSGGSATQGHGPALPGAAAPGAASSAGGWGERLERSARRRHTTQRRGGAVLMERSSRRLDLPAFPRSRPRHPELLTLSRLRRLRRLQLIVLLLQLGCLGLLIRVVVREPLPLCRLQQAMQVIRGPIPSPKGSLGA